MVPPGKKLNNQGLLLKVLKKGAKKPLCGMGFLKVNRPRNQLGKKLIGAGKELERKEEGPFLEIKPPECETRNLKSFSRFADPMELRNNQNEGLQKKFFPKLG